MERGYFIIARKLFDGELMNKPPLYMKLWAWMLNSAFWKDGERLKRGQLLTSVPEMQAAMSYKIGFRTKTPTTDEVRSAYEAFMKAGMITATKAGCGVRINICNYSYYQDFKNYEARDETRDETSMKPEGVPNQREGKKGKEGKNNKDLSASFDAEPEIEQPFYLTAKKRKLTGERLQAFDKFMDAFNDKRGRAQAADSWFDIKPLTRSMFEKILAAAKNYAKLRPDIIQNGGTPKMAQGWLTGRRWEDEQQGETKQASSTISAEDRERIKQAEAEMYAE